MEHNSVGLVVDELARYLTEHRMLFSTINPRRFDTQVFERMSREWNDYPVEDLEAYEYAHGSGVVVTAGMLGTPYVPFDDVSWFHPAITDVPNSNTSYVFWIHSVDLGDDEDHIAVEVYCGRSEEHVYNRIVLTIPEDGSSSNGWVGSLMAFLTDFPIMSGREVFYRNIPTLIALSGDRVRIFRAIRRDARREKNITAEEFETTFNLPDAGPFHQCVYSEILTDSGSEQFRQLTLELFDEKVTLEGYFDELHKSLAISRINAWPSLNPSREDENQFIDEYATSIGIHTWFGWLDGQNSSYVRFRSYQVPLGYSMISFGQMWQLPLVVNGVDRLRINQPNWFTDDRANWAIVTNAGDLVSNNFTPGPLLWHSLENRYPHTFGEASRIRHLAVTRKAGFQVLFGVAFRPKTPNSPQYDREPFYDIWLDGLRTNPGRMVATGYFPVASPLGEVVGSYILGKITWGILEDYLAEYRPGFYEELKDWEAASESRGFFSGNSGEPN